MDIKAFRKLLIEKPFEIADGTPEVLSLNIVGSFAGSEDLTGISDIDVVIILDHLTEWKFRELIQKFANLKSVIKERFDYDLKINSTFGPLKFNQPKTVVYHIMIYDIARHIIHCRQSPFTCLDWQRTRLYRKSHISDIYSVKRLMPHHFFSARRGIKDYLNDFFKGVVSFREYSFLDGSIVEEKSVKNMKGKDRYEFAYHIIRFLMANFVKMISGENFIYEIDELVEKFASYLPEINKDYYEELLIIHSCKSKNKFPDSEGDLNHLNEVVIGFLDEFEKNFKLVFKAENEVHLYRHAETSLNNGTFFIGQSFDPSILEMEFPKPEKYNAVYTSPSKRAQETACALGCSLSLKVDPLLFEIDYGLAEGHDLEWLRINYPSIIKAWDKGEDPPFPHGESQQGVIGRVEKFVESLLQSSSGRSLVVSHNVWIRAFVGLSLHIPVKEWFKINIPHNEKLTFYLHPSFGLIPDINAETLHILFKTIEVEEFLAYQNDHDSNCEERYQFWSEVFSTREQFIQERPAISGSTLIPMAGEGSRFRDFGFTTPKPLIHIEGQQMIEKAVNNLPQTESAVFLVRKHLIDKDLSLTLSAMAKSTKTIAVKELTEGQASTCLLGIKEVQEDSPLLIAPCDNGMHWNKNKFEALIKSDVDIVCWTFSRHLAISVKPDAWGYVSVDLDSNVKKVSVKKSITDTPYEEQCIIGTFWFRTANLFKELALELIEKDIRVNNEFYVDSLIGLAAEKKLSVKVFEVDKYISWGKPEDLFEYRKWMELLALYN